MWITGWANGDNETIQKAPPLKFDFLQENYTPANYKDISPIEQYKFQIPEDRNSVTKPLQGQLLFYKVNERWIVFGLEVERTSDTLVFANFYGLAKELVKDLEGACPTEMESGTFNCTDQFDIGIRTEIEDSDFKTEYFVDSYYTKQENKVFDLGQNRSLVFNITNQQISTMDIAVIGGLVANITSSELSFELPPIVECLPMFLFFQPQIKFMMLPSASKGRKRYT
jgi:hypothetical protein